MDGGGELIVALTGGSGFIGGRLAGRLRSDGHDVVLLARGQAPEPGRCDAVVHLAGEPVAQRWTPEAKERIRSSRVDGTRRLVVALSKFSKKPAVLVSASAIGIYGSRGDEVLREDSAVGKGFLPDVAVAWEREARAAEAFGVRVVPVRIGIVLGNGGGALAKMLPPFRLGLGGRMGSGRQWMSWIHIDDLVEVMLFAIRTETLHGPVNGTAPAPVTNAEFTAVLARVLRRPAIFPVPAFALRALFGEMSEVLTGSQRVLPDAVLRSGFQFRHSLLEEALVSLLRQDRATASNSGLGR